MDQLGLAFNEVTKVSRELSELEGKLDAHEHRDNILKAHADTGVQFVAMFCSLTDEQLKGLLFTRQLSLAMNGNFTTVLRQNANTQVLLEVDEMPGELVRTSSEQDQVDTNIEFAPKKTGRKPTKIYEIINLIKASFPGKNEVRIENIVDKVCESNPVKSRLRLHNSTYQCLMINRDKGYGYTFAKGLFTFTEPSV